MYNSASGPGSEIEGSWHSTGPTTSSEGAEQITPEQLYRPKWLEETFMLSHLACSLPPLMDHAMPVSLAAVVEALSTMATQSGDPVNLVASSRTPGMQRLPGVPSI